MKKTFSMGLVLTLWLTAVNLAGEGIWTRKADMPMARTCCGAAAVNGKIYVIGGGRSWYDSAPPTAVYMYDPMMDTWEVKADMPTPRLTLETVTVDGKIYAIGGQRGGTPLRTLEVYDPATDTWEKKADMQTARAWLGAAAVEGKIYAIGGWPSMASVEMYDPATDTWTRKSNMLSGRHVFGISTAKGKIYVIGGSEGGPPVSGVLEYDPDIDRWTRKADMPTARYCYCQSAAEVNGKIYVFGGDLVGGGPGISVVEVYDPATDTWTTGTDMPSPRTETSTAVVNGRIYLIGGSARSGGQPLSLVEEYNPHPLIVDFNGDGIVDCADICMMMDYWGTDEPLYDIAPPPSGDGIVDVQDLILLTEHLFEKPGLVANWALDESEGTVAQDSAGSNDAVTFGEPLWLPMGGMVDGAIQLDGIDDCLITDSILDLTKRSLSVLAWVKGGMPGQVVLSQISGVNWLCTDPSEGNLMTELTCFGRSAKPLQSQTNITDDNWHRIGLVWDGIYRKLYVDGIVVAEDTQDSLEGSGNGLYFGTGKGMEPGSYWAGLIDDVCIYNRAVNP